MLALCKLTAPTSPEDWAELHRIRKNVLFDARGRTYVPHQPDDRSPDSHPMVFKVGEVGIVGTLRIDLIDERSAGIRLVAVDPAHQRRGYGRHMIVQALEWIRESGCSNVVIRSAPDAVPFYEKIGFQKDEVRVAKTTHVRLGLVLHMVPARR